MKKLKLFSKVAVLGAVALCFCASSIQAAGADDKAALKVGIVNFKSVVEKSKLGKDEQASFEALKKQMEKTLEEKEKTLNEIAVRFNDPDYLDSLSPEAEADVKHKFRTINQELTQLQQQYYQALSQTNFKVVQKLTEAVTAASSKVAKSLSLDLVLNEEASFFWNPAIDISEKVIAELDQTAAK